jgi:hypothetical protein
MVKWSHDRLFSKQLDLTVVRRSTLSSNDGMNESSIIEERDLGVRVIQPWTRDFLGVMTCHIDDRDDR